MNALDMETNPDMHEKSPHASPGHQARSMYRRLGIMAVLSFAAMYFLMFAMVDRLNNVVMNYNQVYMAALMAAPMVLIELLVMAPMYRHGRRNMLIALLAGGAGILSFGLIRVQAGILDRQFARSMIPHHASAILMCREARLADTALRELCFGPNGIVESQEREIEQLRTFLRRGD